MVEQGESRSDQGGCKGSDRIGQRELASLGKRKKFAYTESREGSWSCRTVGWSCERKAWVLGRLFLWADERTGVGRVELILFLGQIVRGLKRKVST